MSEEVVSFEKEIKAFKLEMLEEWQNINSTSKILEEKLKNNIKKHAENILNKSTQCQNQQREEQDLIKDLSDLEEELKSLRHERQAQEKEWEKNQIIVKQLEDNYKLSKKVDNQLKKKSADRDKMDQQHMGYYSKALSTYKDVLGISFVKDSETSGWFYFTHLDPYYPNKKFGVQLTKIKDKHIVTSSEPKLENIGALVSRLNETGKLKDFLFSIRKRFEQIAQ